MGNLAKVAGGNSTTESKTVPTTGMMVDTDGATPSMIVVIKKNSNQLAKSPPSSKVIMVVMLPSLQFHALMLLLLLKFLVRAHTQPLPSFLASLLPLQALLLSATLPNRELRLHSNLVSMLDQSFDI